MNSAIQQSTTTIDGVELRAFPSANDAIKEGFFVLGDRVHDEDGEVVGTCPEARVTDDRYRMELTEEGATSALRKIFTREVALKSAIAERDTALAAIRAIEENTKPIIAKETRKATFWRMVYGPQLQAWFAAYRDQNPKVVNKGKGDQYTEYPKSWKTPAGYGQVKTTVRRSVVTVKPDADASEVAQLLAGNSLEYLLVPSVTFPVLELGDHARVLDWVESCPIKGVNVSFGNTIGSGLVAENEGAELAELIEAGNKEACRLLDLVPPKREFRIATGLNVIDTKIGCTVETIEESELRPEVVKVSK